MANYLCTVRTNYFHVKDPKAFEEFMDHVIGYEENPELWKKTDDDGNPVYGFGCYSNILGYVKDPNGDVIEDIGEAWAKFTDGLCRHVAENDAVLIFEAGYEKLRYVVGGVVVCTVHGVKYSDIQEIGLNIARTELKDPGYITITHY